MALKKRKREYPPPLPCAQPHQELVPGQAGRYIVPQTAPACSLSMAGTTLSTLNRNVPSSGQMCQEFTLAYNPTHGAASDLLGATRDKLGFSTKIAQEFAAVLKDVQARGKKVEWVAHSQGGVIFAEAARIANMSLSLSSVKFHAGANTIGVTNAIFKNAGMSRPRYLNSPLDAVPTIGGFNNLMPITFFQSLWHLPEVLWGERVESPYLALSDL